MSRYNGEEVLVVPRPVFDELGSFNGCRTNAPEYLEAFFQEGVARFIDRELAEESPEYKQLIAYAMFRHEGKILAYARTSKGGEARLHNKLSVGIGGHINPVDGQANNLETYLAGVEREIREEVKFEGDATQKLYALINDDGNEVGRVHLGVVHIFDLNSDDVRSNEDALAEMKFYSLEELSGELYERLESWSAICVDALCGK